MTRAKYICITALAAALICIATMFIRVPIPLGYAHLGNTFIFLTSAIFGGQIGLLSAGIGSALADLLGGYPIWIVPTLIIKTAMGFFIGKAARHKGKSFRVFSPKILLAVVLVNIWMVAGYSFSGALLYGSVAAGIASAPALAVEAAVNTILFYVLGFAVEKSKMLSVLYKE